jgi:DNA-binding CsgD family transcriptional regulator
LWKNTGLYCYNNDDWKIILAEKYTLKDENNNAVALVSHISDLTHSNVVDINKFISLTSNNKYSQLPKQQGGYLIGHDSMQIPLSTRQSECLFFLVRGKTIKEIAQILRLSSRTVEIYVEQLKVKFGCQRKSDLIARSIASGYINNIPESLFNLFTNTSQLAVRAKVR